MPSTVGIRQGGKLGMDRLRVPVPARHKSNCAAGAFGRTAGRFQPAGVRRQVIVNGVLLQSVAFIEYFRLGRIITRFTVAGIAALGI
jgi:hypothetical protein